MKSQTEVGKRIALARKANGLNQVELAQHIGRDHTSLSKLEKGQVRPNMEVIGAISVALHVPVQWLLFGTGDDGGVTAQAVTQPPAVSPRTVALLRRSQKEISSIVGLEITDEQTVEWLVRKAGIHDDVL